MAKSTRKQKLKAKDFQKKKLKVGKGKDKPGNVTDTSFAARTISIKDQHLEHSNDLTKRLPLLKHHNVSVRKETLQLFQKSLPTIIDSSMMTPLLNQAIPLICDDSKQVRLAFIDLIDEIGKLNEQVLRLHCKYFVLYISMSMTHIVTAIQADSTKVLRVLLKYCGEEICRQAWVKLLDGIFSVLGWGKNGKNQAAGIVHTRKKDAKTVAIHLEALHDFIKYGCTDSNELNSNEGDGGETGSNDDNNQIINEPNQFLIPNFPQPYEYLKLFTRELRKEGGSSETNSNTLNSNNSSLYSQDIANRLQILKEQYLASIEKELDLLIKEGGESGKTSNNLKQLLSEVY
ncbi:hypothetical protein Kpol_1055p12 [Vanderwaltozyma polyspora DSM 70294]|uniref:Pre-rRNA-processing protein n=1 Tax=Vanderwaltozyma polyspora (strain ATCC 22028 / DSM 70294 / BCRC 21397 / CBS 2163 / NBRC 10782 / NRRL Y-8283 / UCD 57-17) TaxID=436907 RepID=A7TG86_VANPO|nr:uncharacterized protein Kpol_1055p12 [Vanderwaltozyma polyspora DSM 70294]EDO18656.1 hypothetical protein Kpol_1055p12 [Vanderwaltozyma polyspora DSM 70294]